MLLEDGASEILLKPFYEYYKTYIEDFENTILSIKNSKNEDDINQIIRRFIKKEKSSLDYTLNLLYIEVSSLHHLN